MLGRLVKDRTNVEQIYLHSLPIKEHEITNMLLSGLKDEVLKIKPVQKQTRAGQRLVPAPRSTGIVGAPVPKKLLQMAGIDDCYTSAVGQTATLGTDLWKDNELPANPLDRKVEPGAVGDKND